MNGRAATVAVALGLVGLLGGGCREVPPGAVHKEKKREAEPAVPAAAMAAVATNGGPVSFYSPPSFAKLAESVAPSVVSVFSVRAVRDALPYDPEATRFKSRLGSGFVVDGEGHILTGARVLAGADAVMVAFHDRHEARATVIGKDLPTDLAVLRVGAKDLGDTLVPARLGDSDAVEVGDWVVAIGNPYGLSHTVTAGIISAMGRGAHEIPDAPGRSMFLQTDAAINPGNAGGPLIDLDGNVIGVCADVEGPGRGISFAVPVNLANRVLAAIKDKGHVERSYLGVYVSEVTPAIARAVGRVETHGALVTDIMARSPASRAGLARGDIILEMGGAKVPGPAELARITETAPPRVALIIVIWRDGEEHAIKVAPAPLPETGD